MKCENCGTEFNEGVFCPECGTKIKPELSPEECAKKQEIEQIAKEKTEEGKDNRELELAEQKTEQERITKERKEKQSGMAIAALVCGIISICSCGIIFIPEILGIVFACIAMKDKNRKQTMAKVGLILSVVSFALFFFLMIILGSGDSVTKESTTEASTTQEETTVEVETTQEVTTQEKEQTTTEIQAKESETKTEFNPSDYRKDISYESLTRTPDKYKGMKIQITGEVVQVIEEEDELDIRICLEGTADYIYLVCKPDVTDVRILDKDNITYYGVYQGLYTYETVMGGEETVPLFSVDSLNINNYDGTSDSASGALREGTYVFNDGAVTSTADFTYQDGEAFYCHIYATSDDKGYGLVECFLTDNGDGTYTGMIPDEGTIDISVNGSEITVTTHPYAGCEIYFERLDGKYVYQ